MSQSRTAGFKTGLKRRMWNTVSQSRTAGFKTTLSARECSTILCYELQSRTAGFKTISGSDMTAHVIALIVTIPHSGLQNLPYSVAKITWDFLLSHNNLRDITTHNSRCCQVGLISCRPPILQKSWGSTEILQAQGLDFSPL